MIKPEPPVAFLKKQDDAAGRRFTPLLPGSRCHRLLLTG